MATDSHHSRNGDEKFAVCRHAIREQLATKAGLSFGLCSRLKFFLQETIQFKP